MKFLLSFIFIVLGVICLSETQVAELKSVIVIFRHGERNILSSYPKDPYANSTYWPGGYGQLTNKGKQQHYELGKWFRERYQHFIPEKYSKDDIYVQSTDTDRTLMSAQAHLAGLYPPIEDQIWNSQLKWQPIPIHTIPRELDVVLHMGRSCPKYHKLIKQLLKSDEFLAYQEELAGVYKYVSNNTNSSINSINDLSGLADTLFVEESRGFALPEWTNAVYPGILKQWLGFSQRIPAYTPQLGRLKAGPLIYEVVKNFEKVTKGKSYFKYKIYSAHDSTIAGVLTTLGVFDNFVPPYASSIILELQQYKLKHYISIWYKNDTVPLKVTLPGCRFYCLIDDFVNLLRNVTVDLHTWEEECNECSK